MDEHQEEIRQLAHRLWEAAGSPEGASDQFWLEAERQLAGPAPGGQSEGRTEQTADPAQESDPVTGEAKWKEDIKKRREAVDALTLHFAGRGHVERHQEPDGRVAPGSFTRQRGSETALCMAFARSESSSSPLPP